MHARVFWPRLLGGVMEGLEAIFRWLHVLAGIVWIGHLYFFNWVNGPFQAKIDGPTKKLVNPELMPRALDWFRWGAAYTWITGVLLLGLVYYRGERARQQSARGCDRFVCIGRNYHRIVRAFCSLQLPRDSDSHRGTVRNDHGVQCVVSNLARTTEDHSRDKEWRNGGRQRGEACGLEITPQHVHVRPFALGHDRTAHDLFRGRQSWHPERLLLDIPADHHHRRLACCLSDIQEGGQGSGVLKTGHKKAQNFTKEPVVFCAFLW